MHLADAFIQSDLKCIQVIHVLSVCVFPGNWTHDLCDYLGKGEVLTNTDLDRFVNNIWEK